MSADEVSNIMEEAQALMDDLAVGDDEEGVPTAGGSNPIVIDGFSIDDVLDESPLGQSNIIDARTKVKEGEDPLSAMTSPLMPVPPLDNGNSIAISQTNNTTRPAMTTFSDVKAPTFSDVKAHAHGFASNMVNFATKAAANVAAVAASQPVSAVLLSSQQPTMSLSNSLTHLTAAPPVELDNDQKTALIEKHLGTLLPGERVIMFLSNLLHVSDSSGWEYNYVSSSVTPPDNSMWCCCMTFYRVVLFYTDEKIASKEGIIPDEWDEDCWPSRPKNRQLQMPLSSMDRVEKSVYTTAQNTTLMGLVMHGKDNGRQLRFTTTSYSDTLRVHEAMQTYAFPGRRNLGYLFAFESKREEVMASIVENEPGRKTVTLKPASRRFDPLQEFRRQFGVLQPCPWAIYENINNNYQICMSYPSVLVGPASLPETSPESQRIIRQMASFRSEKRFTALTWSSGKDGASLWRAAQPKVGIQGNRNNADEFYLRHIAESAARCNALRTDKSPMPNREYIQKLTGQPDFGLSPGGTLKIMDMRPRSSALANKTSGYGYENTSNYPGSTLQFCSITNIHGVRDAYQKMSSLCLSTTSQDSQWMSLIEDTKWLHHIRLILSASWEAAFFIHVHRMPVFLHCSHGWDRTSQVAVLAQLFLDPYYRTRAGFACLIEKDFLSFGHPFHTRCAHGEGRENASVTSDEGQISPIFLQFLDCVYQLVNLFPEKFEFNPTYLLVLSENLHSCRFGTLLCDTERERELVANIRQRTHSIWEYLESREDCNCKNYNPSSKVLLMPLPMLLRSVSLWTDRHAMYGPKPTIRNPMLPDQIEPVKNMSYKSI
mmetsp:Transcript_4414/g.5104  ORF Transcript_4414/g.5104 Transcript_4414/m.5104 type:complete len:826 (+) Transcript_4414:284-2761(+)|eukprot:CAMPEP_0194151458 /NCGR_PEP_ID=MMETSP0152-20130528/48165_1 /TAXON_ID=1049557 /ORGANISM="Thalassiothrix antarctica, Strain L6-D1" /LENGTH=825 /DNA_ID=CAMNT_0038855265 /DNA_START=281 /DNA_END=2758 /DNA_ORIENTATION=-